uniref:Uncharacterized protein n=1 Tax=Vitis vinifera TaxID=29760 RepID=F6HT87_VITVI
MVLVKVAALVVGAGVAAVAVEVALHMVQEAMVLVPEVVKAAGVVVAMALVEAKVVVVVVGVVVAVDQVVEQPLVLGGSMEWDMEEGLGVGKVVVMVVGMLLEKTSQSKMDTYHIYMIKNNDIYWAG